MEPETHLPHTDAALYDYHVGALAEEYERAVEEVRAHGSTGRWSAWVPLRSSSSKPSREHISASAEHRQRLVPTYGEALVEQGSVSPGSSPSMRTCKDCGLVEFHERFRSASSSAESRSRTWSPRRGPWLSRG